MENLEQTNKSLEAEATALLDKVTGKAEVKPAPTEDKPEAELNNEPAEAEDSEQEIASEDKEDKPFKVFRTEDEFKSEINKRVMSEADKRVQTYADQVKVLKKQNTDLTRQITARADEKDFLAIKEEESETIGEDKARVRDEARRRLIGKFNEYKEKSAEIEDKEATFKERYTQLNAVEQRQIARDLFYQHFLPGRNQLISLEEDFISEMLKGDYSRREMEMIAEKRGAEHRSKQKRDAKPDSGRITSAGPGGKFTRGNLAQYDPKGKSVIDMQKDAEALLNQVTKR